MFISYLKDMKSWILFFVLALGFADVLIWLDAGIDVEFFCLFYILIFYCLFSLLYLLSGDIEKK